MSDQLAIRAVIFDMDGVLTDSEPLINAAAIAMFKEKGLTVQPEDFLPFVGAGEDRYLGGVAEKYRFPLDLPAAKARTYEIYLGLVPARLEAFPGAGDLVRACRQAGLRIAVASSADRVKVEANLRKIGLPPETWDTVVYGEEVSRKKPDPEIFLRAASKLGVSPSESVVIEDAVNGVQAAKAAGMRCLAVAQTFSAEQLKQADLIRSKISNVFAADLIGLGQPGTVTQAPAPGTSLVSPPSIVPELPSLPTEPERRWGFWGSLGITVVILLAAILVQVGMAVLWAVVITLRGQPFPHNVASNGLLLALCACGSAPVIVALSWLFTKMRAGQGALAYLALRPAPIRTYIRWSIFLLLLVAVSDTITVLTSRPLVPTSMVDAYATAGFVPLFWLALIVAAPVAEETLFRGFLFEGTVHSRLGPVGAIILTSMIWASIHVQYDLYGILTIFVSGLFLGYARLRTKSIYLTMALHALMNLIATIETVILLRMVKA
jgi:HAD superfamily hydrolase (TIGR01509 family)